MARINLLPWRAERRRQRKQQFNMMLGVAALAGLVLSGLIWLYYSGQISGQKDRNTYLQGQIAALTARQVQADVDAQIKPALADGRLLPALETWARDLGKKDIAALTAFLTAAKPIPALAGTQTGGKAPMATASGDQQLSADELAVCNSMGITPEAYRKAGTAMATGAAA